MDPVTGISLLSKFLPFLKTFSTRWVRWRQNPRALEIVQIVKSEVREHGRVEREVHSGRQQADLQTAIEWLEQDGYTYDFLPNSVTRGLPKFIIRAGTPPRR